MIKSVTKLKINTRIVFYLLSSTILQQALFTESSAIALDLETQTGIDLSDNLSTYSEPVSNLYEANISRVGNAQQSATNFTVADVVPIEDYKVKPLQLPGEEEGKPQLIPTKPSTSNEQRKKPEPQKPHTSKETLIQKLRLSKKPQKKPQEIIIAALTISTLKYPAVVNPTNNTFSSQSFQPNKGENYLDTDIRVRDAQENQIVNKFNYAHFPKGDQFYWVLNDNRIVFETKGFQAGIVYQGRERQTIIIENVTSQQAFWGLQSLTVIPRSFKDLTPEVDTKDLSVTSIAGQLINPEGIPAGKVVINSGVNLNDPNVTVLKNPTPVLGSGSTFSSDGGKALFQNLDANNAPQILQAYPTTDLKPLLDGGNVLLKKGEIIPNKALEEAGIFWGDILTGKGFDFTAPVSSLPGIKIAQQSRFDNYDLLNIAVNPFLTPVARDLHYLNSLLWVSFGKRKPEVEILSQSKYTYDWHKLYINYPHNRSLIQYNKTVTHATYSNIFSNPGLSITANLASGNIDAKQTISASLGMAIGGIFELIKLNNIARTLEEARQKLKQGEGFALSNNPGTAVQKRQINQRLNRTLAYTNAASNLEQVSGTFTLPSKITTTNSKIFQVRIGTSKRAVQFFEQDTKILHPGDTYFSDISLSNQKFGFLNFIGSQIPLNDTSIAPINESSAVEVILTNSKGKQFVQQFSSRDNTVVPINIRTSDFAFDYMELTRIDKVGIKFKSFNGYLSFPTVELLASGSAGDFNYSAGLGTWFNLDAGSAPGVAKNNLGLPEPTVGVYTNILLNYIKTNVQLNSQKKPVALNTHIPFVKIDWNSASNNNNPFSILFSYSFDRQEKNLGYSIAPSVLFIQNNSNGDLLGLINGQFSTSDGWNLKTNLEIGKETFFEVQGLQRISQNLSVGAYVRNYSLNNEGLSSRVSGINYGGILKQYFSQNNVFLDAQIGTGDNGFDFHLQGSYQF